MDLRMLLCLTMGESLLSTNVKHKISVCSFEVMPKEIYEFIARVRISREFQIRCITN